MIFFWWVLVSKSCEMMRVLVFHFFSLEGGCCTKSQVNVFLDLTFSVFEKVE